jgi:hypothetical protein
MATSVPVTPVSDEPRLAVREIPRLPKAAAVKALAEKLEGTRGFDVGSATALARTAVDPADFRRRLDRPAPIRVPGAVLWTVEADVWAPTIVPFVANYREAAGRRFPADQSAPASEAPDHPPIRRPLGDPDGRAVLDIEVAAQDQLVRAAEASVSYLVQHNPLGESIEEKGVMFPITLVATAVSVGGKDERIHLPATADGSSRAAGALDVLGLEIEDVVGRYRSDSRSLAGLIGRIRSIFDRPLSQVSGEEVGQANALILPARIIVGFEPDLTGKADFAKAVHNYVQLTHGDVPPAPWSATAKIDAKADSVVAELERNDVITMNKALYLEGLFDAEGAREHGFPAQADERGLVIASLLSQEKGPVHAAIRSGIVQASDRKNVTKKVKAEIISELALRGARSGLSEKELSVAREVLANAYGNPAIWDQGMQPSGKSPDELLAEAREERESGEAGPATAELGALGAFWLVVKRVLRDPRFFREETFTDSRNPSRVLASMMDSEWGLRILSRAIVDGRAGRDISRVDREGSPEPSTGDGVAEAHHAWLRGTVVPPEHARSESKEAEVLPPVPERVFMERRKDLEKAVEIIEQRHAELRKVCAGDGEPMVDKQGLPEAAAEELRERLEAVSRALVVYGARWAASSGSTEMEADR